MSKKIYFDSVSTTSLNEEVLKSYKQLLDTYYCNSDALYDDGVAVYNLQEKSRRLIGEMLGVEAEEVIFTSGASEANSLAIKGYCLNYPGRGHLITSTYEHSSVYNAFKQLEEVFGFEVTYLKPNKHGVIEPEQVRSALRDNTLLVSIMMVNNEIGAINDVTKIAEIVRHHSGTVFHSDLTQAIGKVPVDLRNIDLASFSAHKIHGLKGSGALIKKRHIRLLPLISGGQQEFGLRGGTSNAPANIVLAKTLRIALEQMERQHAHLEHLHNYFKEHIKAVNGVSINSDEKALPSLFNISTPLTSEVLLNVLNSRGIMVSSKSTCGSRKNEENRALAALDVDDNYVIRVSFDFSNTTAEIDCFIDCLKEAIKHYA